MSVQEHGGPAFPVGVYDHQTFAEKTVGETRRLLSGMTLRDYFAGQALAAMDLQINIAEPAAAYMAKSAYLVADAMLKARAS